MHRAWVTTVILEANIVIQLKRWSDFVDRSAPHFYVLGDGKWESLLNRLSSIFCHHFASCMSGKTYRSTLGAALSETTCHRQLTSDLKDLRGFVICANQMVLLQSLRGHRHLLRFLGRKVKSCKVATVCMHMLEGIRVGADMPVRADMQSGPRTYTVRCLISQLQWYPTDLLNPKCDRIL